jgi:ABC-2 type transport system permease protein
MNVIFALWLRQMKRFRRSRARMVAALGQPVLFLFALGYGFGPIFQRAGQGNYIQFLAPGVIGMTILFGGVLSGVELIWDRQFGFFKEMLVAPVPRLTIMIGRTVGGASVAVLQGLLVTAICALAGFRSADPKGWLLGLVFMALMALTFTAFGTAAASIISEFQAFQLVINFMVMPMFFLSGALFPLKDAPPALQMLSRLDPVSYGVDGLRVALIGGGSHFGVGVDVGALCVISAVLLLLGAFLFSKIQI